MAWDSNQWGTAMPFNSTGNQPDYLQQMFPVTNGVDLNAGGSGAPDSGGGMMSGIGDWFSNSGFLGKTGADGSKTAGWGGAAFGALQGIGNAYLGFKQLGLAKDTFNENKRQFEMNWGAQKKTINSRLEDRQMARVAANPGAYQSVGDYMKKNGI